LRTRLVYSYVCKAVTSYRVGPLSSRYRPRLMGRRR